MSTKVTLLVSVLLIAAVGIYTQAVYAGLPERIPTHWGLNGQPDQWDHKGMGALLMPGMMVLLLLMMFGLPYLSPQRFRVESFRQTWNAVFLLVLGMMGYLQVIMLQAASHPGPLSNRLLIGGICLFLAAIGLFMPRVGRNFWMGVRTPWTLASDKVWTATHQLAGWTMGLSGLLAALLILAGLSPVAAFALVIVGAFVPVFYSLWLYKALERAGQLGEA